MNKQQISLPSLGICLPSDFKFEKYDPQDPGSLLIFSSEEPNLGLTFEILYLPDEGVTATGGYWLQNWDPDGAAQWHDLLANMTQVCLWLKDCQTALKWALQHYPMMKEH
ncbi:hypothetical protein BLI708_00275 [Bifidobacterium imperatoris]|uniref:Uncharacterized protein n=1 Tax=Bifidobacterium imperatoris TaxID=2020965 RepID=A0A2N5IPV2_9BIFI|nr:hypothetical protein [Bifidobacterium imperatoris]PLS23988.1 hypothetical protein Tam1G_1972 [Bifidobacterium imperatoris]QSY57817.1 hypothetical protein BLI708_00275 [Bifidobacterium imperatoris]